MKPRIKLLTHALGQIINQRESGFFDLSEQTIDLTARSLLKMSLVNLTEVEIDILVDHFYHSLDPMGENAIIAAELLSELVTLGEIRGHSRDDLTEKIFLLYIESLAFIDPGHQAAIIPKITALADKLQQIDGSPDLSRNLLKYYQHTGEFAKAEDALHELLDTGDPQAREIGMQFYQTLLFRADTDLIRGNLPREEVLEGWAHLSTLQNNTPN